MSTARPAAVRASDAEREDTVVALQRALGEGRLDLEEADERITAAYAARHRHELAPLVADLPASDDAGRPPPRAGRGPVVVAAIALGLGALGGVAAGGLGVLAAEAGHHMAHEAAHHPGPAGSWSHPMPGPGDGSAPGSFWLPPRGS